MLNEFTPSSPSITVLVNLGFCYESLGTLYLRTAATRGIGRSARQVAADQSRGWYRKSAEVWNEWKRRGIATHDSERERLKVDQLLRAQGY
jgi:eukaryotic-like serine/threonine-protein kinase